MWSTLMAMDPVVITSFALAGVLLNLTPGADVLFATACGLSGGKRAGVAAAVGITLGAVVHLSLAAVGLSALLLAVPQAYDAIRYVGAVYLAYLAWKSWTAAPVLDQPQASRDLRNVIRRGFLTNALNPKVALFILAFLPQFTDPAIGPIWHQILFLGLVFATTGLIITSAYGALAGVIGSRLKTAGRVLNRISAFVFGGLAARLVLD